MKFCEPPEARAALGKHWILGETFAHIYSVLSAQGAQVKYGKGYRELTIGDIVEMCEGQLAFEGMMILGAAAEMFSTLFPDDEASANRFRTLQKMLKYGLENKNEILIYELGFGDRLVARSLSFLTGRPKNKHSLLRIMLKEQEKHRKQLEKIPAYYSKIFSNLVTANDN